MGLPRSSLVAKPRSLAPDPFALAPTQLDMSVPPVAISTPPMATSDLTGPTPSDLLARAAALGPARPSLDSIAPTSDPILEAKSQPEIAARRAKLRRVVKGLVGVCGAMCIVAVVVSIVSGSPDAANAATNASANALDNVPVRSSVPVEKIAGPSRTKAAPMQNAVAARGRFSPRRR